jgi:hypothetical protein
MSISAGQIMIAMCPRGESRLKYMPAIAAELVLGMSAVAELAIDE